MRGKVKKAKRKKNEKKWRFIEIQAVAKEGH